MNLDDDAVQGHGLQLAARDLLPLQLLENPVEHPIFRPSVHAYVNGVPVAQPGQQPTPLAALFGDVQHGIEHLQVRKPNVAALHREVRGNAGIFRFCDLHPWMTTRLA